MKCNVYEVEVLINQIDGAFGNKPEIKKTYNVLAISEDAAKKKCQKFLQWDNREILENKSYCISCPTLKLLVENVEY